MIPVYCTDDVCAAVQAIIDESGLPKTAYLPDAGLYLQADADGIALRKAGEKVRCVPILPVGPPITGVQKAAAN